MSAEPTPSFEAALKELEDIVRQLESGELSLDASITLYERGQKLKQVCEARLADAKARIEQIQQGSGGEISARPFDAA
ncbi:exodeoxyribonuclease VII small subunit [Sandarakinorhabdus rubra]|uniref:exodeoxyribonuclease VII small subunit n=1 Tax=Sandarakinorhabdus rubra TaxID=2672568 RepID=UPI0013DD1B37|nr:exodeoxyribonuclease VII small subunit [Sandarakinorhabdus rubra]